MSSRAARRGTGITTSIATGATQRMPMGRQPNPPILAQIRAILASLNPIERLIADRVLADPEGVITSSISEISEQAGASPASVVKFCRSLGLKGFAEFKITLTRDLAQSGMPAMPGVGGVQERAVLARVFHFHAQSLRETLQLNPTDTFERVAHALESAHRIEFFSIGLSYPVAYTAYSKFVLLGLPVATEADAHVQLIKATQLKSGDLAFAISCSGTTRETVQCLEVARAHGATTVCITNAMKSPIAIKSDLALYATPSEIKYFQAPLASRITQLAVIDALFVSLALKRKTRTAALLQHAGEELAKRR